MERIQAFSPGRVEDRANDLAGMNVAGIGLRGLDSVNGVIFQREGLDYRTYIRSKRSRGITGFVANHQLLVRKVWEDRAPDRVLTNSYSLNASDNGEQVVLEVLRFSEFAYGQVFGDAGVVLNLIRAGMVFVPDAVPLEEQRRMVNLFRL